MTTILHLTTTVKPDHRKAGKTLHFRLGINNRVLRYSLHEKDTRHVTSCCGALGHTGDVSTWHNVGCKALRSIMFDDVDGLEREERKTWLLAAHYVAAAYGFTL